MSGFRFYLLDVAGDPVTILIEALTKDFFAFLEQAHEVLDSVSFG